MSLITAAVARFFRRTFLPLLGAVWLLAPATVAAAEADPALNASMGEIGVLMSGLLNDKVLNNPDATLKQLDQLDTRFRAMEPHVGERGPAFRISWQTMVEQIGRTRDAVDAGTATRETLNNLVHGIASACTGCHTQDDKGKALGFGSLVPETGDTLQKARFRYVVRDYDAALQLYGQYLDAQEKLAYSGPVLDALEGELTILAQVKRDTELGSRHFRQRLERSGSRMSRQMRKDMQAWVKGFENIRKLGLKAGDTGFADLESYARTFLLPHEGSPIVVDERDKVAYLWVRGLIHEYVQANPRDAQMPELLYWLALSDRVLDYNFYYSLADLYLKECIVRYPASDTAEDCYAEYERYVEFAYSGSGGVHVPTEVRDQLILWREVLDAAHAATEVPATEPVNAPVKAPAAAPSN